jgi:hypothetical protein
MLVFQGQIAGTSVRVHTLLAEYSQQTEPSVLQTKGKLIPVAMATLNVADSGES